MNNNSSRKVLFIFLVFFVSTAGYALEPEQILVIATSDIPASVKLAQYYCAKRAVPTNNILALHLGKNLIDTISRIYYEKQLAEPIRSKLYDLEIANITTPQTPQEVFGNPIRCLLTTYGVPIKIGRRPALNDMKDELKKLNKLFDQEKNKLRQLEQSGTSGANAQKEKVKIRLNLLQSAVDRIIGKETEASVDSELSMVLFGDYELYRWQPNQLKHKTPYWDFRPLMVCRLDGPGFGVARGLVDKALIAEKTGLIGIAYIDSGHSRRNTDKPLFVEYDRSLLDLAAIIKSRTQIPVVEERSSAVFAPGQCQSAAIYCGWYSLKNYVDAFEFVDGAIGYHIASWEAVDLRDPNSTQWCPAMLADGITATLGAVSEPYLQAFPMPREFFVELFEGCCLVEAYYRTQPFNSWQLVLIGDPLYTPFKISVSSGLSAK